MATPIYLSFYEFDEPGATEEGSFHWGIALPRPENQNRLDGRVDIFQVGTPDEEDVDAGADPDAWETNHRSEDRPVDLTKSASFIALVRLPPLLPAKSVVEHFLRQQDAGQGDTPLVLARDEWSCAQWVIRVLQRIDNLGWFSESPPKDLQDRDSFYERLVALVRAHALGTGSVSAVVVDTVYVLELGG